MCKRLTTPLALLQRKKDVGVEFSLYVYVHGGQSFLSTSVVAEELLVAVSSVSSLRYIEKMLKVGLSYDTYCLETSG